MVKMYFFIKNNFFIILDTFQKIVDEIRCFLFCCGVTLDPLQVVPQARSWERPCEDAGGYNYLTFPRRGQLLAQPSSGHWTTLYTKYQVFENMRNEGVIFKKYLVDLFWNVP